MADLILPRKKRIDELVVVDNKNATYAPLSMTQASAQPKISVGQAQPRQQITGVSQAPAFRGVVNVTGAAPTRQRPSSPLDFFRPVSQGGANVFADLSNFARTEIVKPTVDAAVTSFQQGRTGLEVGKQGVRGISSPERAEQYLAPYKEDLSSGKITQEQYDALSKKVSQQTGRNVEAIKTAEKATGNKFDPSAGVVATLETALNLGGTGEAVNLAARGARTGANKVAGVASDFARGQAIDTSTRDAEKVIADAARDVAARQVEREVSPNTGIPISTRPQVTARQPYSVQEGLNIPENISTRLRESGIAGVRKQDTPYGIEYDPNTRMINAKDQSFLTEDNLYHELGHDLYLNKLTPEERALFDASGDAAKQARGRKGYTESDVASEDFSDYVRQALTGKLRQVPEKYRSVVAKYAQVSEQAAQESAQTGEPFRQVLDRKLAEIPTKQASAKTNELPRVEPLKNEAQDVVDQQQLLQASQLANRPQVALKGDSAPIIREQGNALPISEEIAQAAQASRERYAPVSLRSKVGEAWNPYNEGVKLDQRLANQMGVPLRDLPKNRSLEALAERTRNSGQEAESFLRNSDTASVVQKYGYGTPESNDFNTYRLFMRDLEQRADGRTPLFRNYSDADMAQFVAEYESRNPGAREDLLALSRDIQHVQDEAVRRGVVDANTVDSARIKKDGSQYQYYTPAARALPEETQRASINANGVAGGARQSIITDLKGSDIPLDPSFDSITDYVNTAYKQMAKAETSQEFAQRVRDGLVPGARFVDTAENFAERKAMRDLQKSTGKPKDMNNYAELMPDPTTGLQVLTGREGGQPFKIEITPEQARFLQGLGDEKLNVVLKSAKAIQAPFRNVLTGTLNFPFQVISAGWNAFISPTLSPQGIRVYGPKAVTEAFKSFNGNAEFQQLLRSKGAQQFTGNLEASSKITTAEALAAERDILSKTKFNITNPGKLWRLLDKPGAKIEGVQRTGIAKAAFDARLRKGGNEAEAIADAVYAYNNVLPNFGRASSFVRGVDSLAMYAGASQAGTRALLTAVKRDPVGVGTRLSLLTTGLVGMSAAAFANESAQEFYEDMENSGKGYITQNNGIIMLPGAHKVTKEEAAQDPSKREGEWEGVVKVPLPPEIRPIQNAIQAQMLANAQGEGVPLGTYAVALGDFLTGGVRTLSNPGTDLAYGLATNVDRFTGRDIVPPELQRKPVEEQKFSTTSEVAINIGKALGVSPLKVDYVLSKAGLPGQSIKGIGEEGGPIASTVNSVANRFTNTFGQKEGTKFFNKVEEIASGIKNDDDMKAFETLHASKGDGGKSLDKSAERYKILLARPDVLDAERKLNEWSVSQGKPGNPLFELTPEQQEKVFRYRASKDLNAAKQAYDKNGNPLFTALGLDEKWYDDFRNRESEFYDTVKSNEAENTTSVLSYSGAKKPEANSELQAKLDFYYTLPSGTGERSAFLDSNPDVLDYWASNDKFTNAERVAIGLKPVSDEPASGKSRGSYSRYGNKGGSGGKKAFNARQYAININAGGEIAKPTVKAKGGKPAVNPKKYSARERRASPKVTLKKKES